MLKVTILMVVALLSIASGASKLLQAPAEMDFLRGVGLGDGMILAFGLLQVTGGLLMAFKGARGIGAKIAAIGFGISSIIIFVSGNPLFGLLSLVPIALAIYTLKGDPQA